MPGPGEEFANLYIRGVNESRNGEVLDAQEILNVLDVFGADGLRWYMIGALEGIEAREEEAGEEWELLEASIAYVVYESEVSILEETEEVLKIRVAGVPADLSPDVDLHVVNDEEEIVRGGHIRAVEFEESVPDAPGQEGSEEEDGDESEVEVYPAVVTVEKWKYEITEYEDPDDFLR